MMRLKFNTALLSLILVGFAFTLVCCEDDDEPQPTPTPVTCVGGSGGNKVIRVDMRHHTVLIPSDATYPDTVWIKYNATNGGSGYDAMVIGNPGDTLFSFSGLKCGDYFLTAAGFDTSISLPVSGGLRVTLSSTDDTVSTSIPVTE